MLQLDTQKNLQLLNFLENRHHSCGPPAPGGCPSTNTPRDYLTPGSFFLPSAGSRAVNAGQAPHCSNTEHKPAELTRTCSTGHHDPQENTCLKQNTKCSLKKKRDTKPLLLAGKCDCSFDHRENVINTQTSPCS